MLLYSIVISLAGYATGNAVVDKIGAIADLPTALERVNAADSLIDATGLASMSASEQALLVAIYFGASQEMAQNSEKEATETFEKAAYLYLEANKLNEEEASATYEMVAEGYGEFIRATFQKYFDAKESQ